MRVTIAWNLFEDDDPIITVTLGMHVLNVFPRFLGMAKESKDMWRLEKAIMKPVVVLAVGAKQLNIFERKVYRRILGPILLLLLLLVFSP
jgi:hypothetical protein